MSVIRFAQTGREPCAASGRFRSFGTGARSRGRQSICHFQNRLLPRQTGSPTQRKNRFTSCFPLAYRITSRFREENC